MFRYRAKCVERNKPIFVFNTMNDQRAYLNILITLWCDIVVRKTCHKSTVQRYFNVSYSTMIAGFIERRSYIYDVVACSLRMLF